MMKTNEMIALVNNISITSLPVISVLGGNVMHGMKKTDLGFKGFGEAYFSYIEKNKIKAWKKHLKMNLNLIVPFGTVMFVFMDDSGSFKTEIIGDKQKLRLSVPPGIWFGFKGIGSEVNIILNISDIIHDDHEVIRKNISEINFDWNA